MQKVGLDYLKVYAPIERLERVILIIAITCGNKQALYHLDVKSTFLKEFDMTGLGKLTYFLAIESTKTSKGLVMQQKKYATDILKRFNIMNCNSPYTSTEVNWKLVKNEDDEIVGHTLCK